MTTKEGKAAFGGRKGSVRGKERTALEEEKILYMVDLIDALVEILSWRKDFMSSRSLNGWKDG